jgi:hypothetical protein
VIRFVLIEQSRSINSVDVEKESIMNARKFNCPKWWLLVMLVVILWSQSTTLASPPPSAPSASTPIVQIPLECEPDQVRTGVEVDGSVAEFDPDELCLDVVAIHAVAPWPGPKFEADVEFRLVHKATGQTVTKVTFSGTCANGTCMDPTFSARTVDGQTCKGKRGPVDEQAVSGVDIAIVVDVSGSVLQYVTVPDLETAVKSLLARLTMNDDVSVRVFASTDRSICQFGVSCDANNFSNAAYSVGGGTALWNSALAEALRLWSFNAGNGRRKFLVLVTDGDDNGSRPDSLMMLTNELRKHHETNVLAVGVGSIGGARIDAMIAETGAQVAGIGGLGFGTSQFATQVADYIYSAAKQYYATHVTFTCPKTSGDPAELELAVATLQPVTRPAPSVAGLAKCGPEGYATPVVVANFSFDAEALSGTQLENQAVKRRVREVVDSYLELRQKHPDITLEIHGFTDDVGGVTYNLGLSNKRALGITELVFSAAKKRGVYDLRRKTAKHPDGAVVVVGAGKSTAYGTAEENRRVEMFIGGLTTAGLSAHCI